MKFNCIIAAFVMLLCLTQAQAQLDRTFVATTGNDANNCSFNAPCRSFNVALPKTNPKGEIIALDSGIYDSFNIVISISVTLTAAPGVHAELSNTSSSGDRITINALTTDAVVLRNLYLSRQTSGGGDGIKVNSVGTLHVENCVISGFTTGIAFALNNPAQAFINDTVVRNSIADAVTFFTNTGLIKASINHCRFENNGISGSSIGNGVNVLKSSRVTVRDSVAAGNSGAGFIVSGGELNLENCESSNNSDGVIALGDSSIKGNALVSNTIVMHNSQFGFRQMGTSVFHSFGNNVVRKNSTNTSGTITVLSGT